MTFFTWSKTAASNDAIDATINAREGQAPSTVNNSMRAMMAALAKWRDDVGGNLATGGTSTAYTVTTNQVYTALSDGIAVTVRLHTRNGAAPTFAPDGLTAKPIQRAYGVAVGSGELAEGSVHGLVYDATADAWIVHGAGSEYAQTSVLRFTDYLSRYATTEEAFQAALVDLYASSVGTRVLDGEGANIVLTEEQDIATIVGKTTYASWHVITGFNFSPTADFPSTTTTRTCDYNFGDTATVDGIACALLTVDDTSGLETGMFVSGSTCSVGSYISSIESSTAITLFSNPYASFTGQTLTFTRHKYALSWKGFDTLSRSVVVLNQFNLGGYASGILMAVDGISNYYQLNRFQSVKDHAVTDWFQGASGLAFDGNDITFATATQTTGHGIIVSSNDTKIRNNRITTCLHHMIVHGSGVLIVGNHWWGGDDAGCILTRREYKGVITGNYIDNNWIELSDESANSATASEAIGGITITGNVFTSRSAPDSSWSWIKLKPHVSGRYLRDFSVSGNTFKDQANGATPFRVERVIEDFGTIDPATHVNVFFVANAFIGITSRTQSPMTLKKTQSTAAATWNVDFGTKLPFAAYPQTVVAIQTHALKNSGGSNEAAACTCNNGSELGSNPDRVQVRFNASYSGDVWVTATTNVSATA